MSMLFAIVFVVVILFGIVSFSGAPYVPSHRKYVKRAFDHFNIGSGDTLVDVGSGDGVVLRIASRYGARAVGYEINPVLVGISRLLSIGDERVRVLMLNFWHVQLPEATTIVYAFSVSRDEKKLTRLLQREANRLQKPLKLLCYGSPFRRMPADSTYEAYSLYTFRPLQSKKA